ncbi:hypothetical protein J3A83DRAFT_4372573 [Scleroderma citrinum]
MSLVASAATLNGAFDSIPVIDIGNASTPEQRVALAREISNACMNVGFFYVTGHGIPQETIDNLFSVMQDYFSLPLETKMKLYHKEVANFKGYAPVLDSNIDPINRGDLHEGFEAGWEELIPKENDEKRVNDGSMAGPNVWPEEPAEFREAFLSYYHAAIGVGKLLFPLFALALDLPETYFDDKTRNAAAIMRTIHYPPQEGPAGDNIVGIGAHSDFEQPGVQALQVLNSEKQWINATPIPGTLVIKRPARTMDKWGHTPSFLPISLTCHLADDIFRSTVHRAINRSGVRRYSVPLFFGTDYHVQIESTNLVQQSPNTALVLCQITLLLFPPQSINMAVDPKDDSPLSHEADPKFDEDEGEESDVYSSGEEGDHSEDDNQYIEEEDEGARKNLTPLLLGSNGGNAYSVEEYEDEDEDDEDEDEDYHEEDGLGTAGHPIVLESDSNSKLAGAGTKRTAEDLDGDDSEDGEGETVAKKTKV